jgi:hypothetical protein
MVDRRLSIFVSFAAALLLIVLVDGWAVAFLPRAIEKVVILAAFLALVYVAIAGLMGRGRRDPPPSQ